jgi:hypothetical protein
LNTLVVGVDRVLLALEMALQPGGPVVVLFQIPAIVTEKSKRGVLLICFIYMFHPGLECKLSSCVRTYESISYQ